jgi:AcrR family transcriptional regulator
MPADERRAALIAATEPLLERYGRDVSTKQIAEAAGVAEGTIFRVFPTKEALVDAVIDDAFDVSRTCDELALIDPGLELFERLTAVVTVLQGRLQKVFTLFHALRLTRQAPQNHDEMRAKQQADNALLNAAVAALVKPDEPVLRLPAYEAAHIIRTLTFSLTHPIISGEPPAGPGEIVHLILYGISGSPTAPYDLHETVPTRGLAC